jgi:uncharacterized membrane protein
VTVGVAAFFAALLGGSVEAVEALTIVLAVGLVAGWRPTLIAVMWALLALAVMIGAFGALLVRVPAADLQLAIGTLLLLFGLRGLHKASLRAAGVMALRDETAQFATMTRRARDQRAGAMLAAQGVLLEGLEVVVIVVGIGAGGAGLIPPVLGAVTAVILVTLAGLLLHRPLARVPENGLKLVVGVVICSLGTFWAAEGMGVHWPGDLASLGGLLVLFALATVLAITISRPAPAVRQT